MVAKKLVLLSLLFMTFVLHSNENYCFSYSEEKVSTDKISKLLDLRSKALKHCLVCDTESCNLKDWDAVNKTNDLLCKSLFCRPIKKKVKSDKLLNSENLGFGKTSVLFTYSIDKEGKIKKVRLLEAEGEMGLKQANFFLESSLGRLRYEPIVIEGKSYSLDNLKGNTSWCIPKSLLENTCSDS
jgi:hypothetical protein|tara:strand:+ start:107 stop:658 length:552 start_codon:yes stop_codon:yes gene_type:complete